MDGPAAGEDIGEFGVSDGGTAGTDDGLVVLPVTGKSEPEETGLGLTAGLSELPGVAVAVCEGPPSIGVVLFGGVPKQRVHTGGGGGSVGKGIALLDDPQTDHTLLS